MITPRRTNMFVDLLSSLGVVDQSSHASSYFFLLALCNSRCSWFWQFPSSLLHWIHNLYITPKILSLPSPSMCQYSSPFCRLLIHRESIMITYRLWTFSSENSTHITIPPHTSSLSTLFLLHTHTHILTHIHFAPKFRGFTKFLTPHLEHWLCSITFSDVMESQTWSYHIDEDASQISMSSSIFLPSFPASFGIPDLNVLPFSLTKCLSKNASGYIQIQNHLMPGSFATIFGKPFPNQRELNFSFSYLSELFSSSLHKIFQTFHSLQMTK